MQSPQKTAQIAQNISTRPPKTSTKLHKNCTKLLKKTALNCTKLLKKSCTKNCSQNITKPAPNCTKKLHHKLHQVAQKTAPKTSLSCTKLHKNQHQTTPKKIRKKKNLAPNHQKAATNHLKSTIKSKFAPKIELCQTTPIMRTLHFVELNVY